MTEQPTAVKIGDVFYSSWGYDQTNVDWFVVSKLSSTGKTATFTHVLGSTVESNGPADRVKANATAAQCKHCFRAIRPFKAASGEAFWRHVENGQEQCYVEQISHFMDDGSRITSWHSRDGRPERTATPETFTARLKYYSDRACANWKSYASVYAWNGESKHQTASGWGH